MIIWGGELVRYSSPANREFWMHYFELYLKCFCPQELTLSLKKKEEEKQRQVELSTFFLRFCPLCESEGENVPHPSFSSLPGRYILLGEQ